MVPQPSVASSASTDAQDTKTEDNTVESQEPPPNLPHEASTSTQQSSSSSPSENPSEEERKRVTTEERKPLQVPDTVHVKITPENLKDYVGPPVYHRDRLYTEVPPHGVSTGLGYLGNGSGAVMPIEAAVCLENLILELF